MNTRSIAVANVALFGALFFSFSTQALAATQPDHLVSIPYFEVAEGTARQQPRVRYSVPPTNRAAAWERFIANSGGTWDALWDLDTEQPIRIYGSGIQAPGSVDSPVTAKAVAENFINEHRELLAPGSDAADFRIAANHLINGIRTVSFFQYRNGARVVGGKLNFRFKFDRLVVIGAEAFSNVNAPAPSEIGKGVAQENAKAWVEDSFKGTAEINGFDGPLILPIVSNDSTDTSLSYRTVFAVEANSVSPRGKWTVYLDVQTGKPVAREQLLRFAEGNLVFNVPELWPGGSRRDYEAAYAAVEFDGSEETTDATGTFTWGSGQLSLTAFARGKFAEVINDDGDEASRDFSISSGEEARWGSSSELIDAQLTAFVHTHIAKEWARGLNPTLAWLAEAIPVTVNIDQSCNAFSDGNAINFFQRSSSCGNTGRLSGVVYHEFGHSIHRQSIIPGVGSFDGALSEGTGDFLAATILNSPAVGVGFFRTSGPLRQIDPVGTEYRWPEDIAGVHATGRIWGGAMWDLRKTFISQYGMSQGVALTDRLFYAAIQRASRIPSAYVEVLVADDDDGNLANGTPNVCAIYEAFDRHGIANALDFGAGLGRPTRVGQTVSFAASPPSVACGATTVSSARLVWRYRDTPSTGGTITMSQTGSGFRGELPETESGRVVQYQVEVSLADGTDTTFPGNQAAPFYEFYLGGTTQLYCTSFESNPVAAGWSFSGPDWEWGESTGNARGPASAFSGTKVIGTVLAAEGIYSTDADSVAKSPVINTAGYSEVRLQYRRWLGVEDAQFDQARILANGEEAWANRDSNQGDNSDTHHLDQDWQFHDVNLSDFTDEGEIQIEFLLKSDAGLEFDGWNIDDFCIVGVGQSICAECTDIKECPACADGVCGNGVIDPGETCDDGNVNEGDGCPSSCVDPLINLPGNEKPESGGCRNSGPASPQGLSLLLLALIATRKPKSAECK